MVKRIGRFFKMLAGQPMPIFVFLFFYALAFHLRLEKKLHLGKLAPNKYHLVKYPGGKIYLNLRESSMERVRAMGVYELEKMRLFEKLLKPNMTVLDVGAHKGYFSLLSAKFVADRGAVYAFEPDEENYLWLNKSIKANRYKSIQSFPIALSNQSGKAPFFKGVKSGHSSLKSDSKLGHTFVITKRLDDFVKEKDIKSIDLIKIDVEGAEMEVLAGAREVLKNNKIKIIMDIHQIDRAKLFDYLSDFGFKFFDYSLGELREVSQEKFVKNHQIKEVLIKKSQ